MDGFVCGRGGGGGGGLVEFSGVLLYWLLMWINYGV